jgi:uncharacterized membrane protein YfcA
MVLAFWMMPRSHGDMGLPTVLAVLTIGAVVGFLGGLFGKGGSAVATPLLALAGIPPFVALASPLPATIPATLIAARAYAKNGFTDWRLVRWSVIVGLPATAFGAYATRWISGSALVVATELILTALGVRFLLRPGALPHEVPIDPLWYRTRMVLVAGTVGVVSGLLANSGGFLLAPLFVVVLHRGIKPAFAASLAVGAALAVPGAIVHAALGHIDWALVVVFGSASIPLSYLGARTALRTNALRLERIYGGALAILGGTLLAVSH